MKFVVIVICLLLVNTNLCRSEATGSPADMATPMDETAAPTTSAPTASTTEVVPPVIDLRSLAQGYTQVYECTLTTSGTFKPEWANQASAEFRSLSKTVCERLLQAVFDDGKKSCFVINAQKPSIIINFIFFLTWPTVPGNFTLAAVQENLAAAFNGTDGFTGASVTVSAPVNLTLTVLPRETPKGIKFRAIRFVGTVVSESYMVAYKNMSSPDYKSKVVKLRNHISYGLKKSATYKALSLVIHGLANGSLAVDYTVTFEKSKAPFTKAAMESLCKEMLTKGFLSIKSCIVKYMFIQLPMCGQGRLTATPAVLIGIGLVWWLRQ